MKCILKKKVACLCPDDMCIVAWILNGGAPKK